MSYSPLADVSPLFEKRGAKHRRCDGVSQVKKTIKNATLYYCT
jgi:hypothetical protein